MDTKSYGYGVYPQKPVSIVWANLRVQLNRYLGVLSRYAWVLLVTVSLGVCLAAWVVAQMPSNYMSEAKMMVTGQIQLQENAEYNEQVDNFFGTQIALMESDDVQKRARVRVQALHPELQLEQVILDVQQEPRASVFDLTVQAPTSAYAQAYLNGLMDEYMDTKKRLRDEKSDSTTAAIQEEMTRLDKQIDDSDAAMHEFQKENNIGFIEKEGNDAAVYLTQKNHDLADLKQEDNLLQMMDFDQALDRAQTDAGSNQAIDTAAAGSSGDEGDKQDSMSFGNSGPIADYQKAKQQLTLLQAQRADLSRNLRPAHPMIRALDEQIEHENDLIQTLRSQSLDALKTHRESIELQIQNLQGVIKEWEAKALDLSTRISEFDRIKTKSDRAKEEYQQLLTNMQSVDVTKNVDQDTIEVLQEASEAQSVKPGLLKIIFFGFLGGLLLGLAILFCIDQFDDRVGSFLELQAHFPETVLGQIPRTVFTEESLLLRHNDNRLALLESFRSLRSSLIYFPVEGARPKTLIVTSAVPNEGKTTISANLAITLAFSGARTLVVDADMRRGKLSQLFGVTEGNGLSTILLRTLPWQQVLHETTIDNLFLIPCGPPLKYPAEHLLGKSADDFLKEVYEQFDYIIFDSPPVTLLDDTLSLAPKIDGAMVVVRFGVSSVRTTRRAMELLLQRQTNILGVICNDVALSESEHNYGYYYGRGIAGYGKEARVTA